MTAKEYRMRIDRANSVFQRICQEVEDMPAHQQLDVAHEQSAMLLQARLDGRMEYIVGAIAYTDLVGYVECLARDLGTR